MLDIGWQELLVIGVLALLVVGPKELPKLLRTVGQWAGKARGMAREFQRSMEDAAREADVEEFRKLRDVKRDVENLTRLDYGEQAKRAQSFMTSSKPASAQTGEATSATSAAAPTTAPETVAPAPTAPSAAPPSAPTPASEAPDTPAPRAAGDAKG